MYIAILREEGFFYYYVHSFPLLSCLFPCLIAFWQFPCSGFGDNTRAWVYTFSNPIMNGTCFLRSPWIDFVLVGVWYLNKPHNNNVVCEHNDFTIFICINSMLRIRHDNDMQKEVRALYMANYSMKRIWKLDTFHRMTQSSTQKVGNYIRCSQTSYNPKCFSKINCGMLAWWRLAAWGRIVNLC